MKYTPITEATAVQFNDLDSIKEMIKCFGEDFKFTLYAEDDWVLQIHDPEDEQEANLADWVITAPSGALKTLVNEDFNKLYKPLEETNEIHA